MAELAPTKQYQARVYEFPDGTTRIIRDICAGHLGLLPEDRRIQCEALVVSPRGDIAWSPCQEGEEFDRIPSIV